MPIASCLTYLPIALSPLFSVFAWVQVHNQRTTFQPENSLFLTLYFKRVFFCFMDQQHISKLAEAAA